jgi:ferric-dicitrate binding protein FerR (iron transport regulator)
MVTGSPAVAEAEVGKIDSAEPGAFAIRGETRSTVENDASVLLDDILGSTQNTGLRISLADNGGDVAVSFRNGSLALRGRDKLAEIEITEGVVLVEKKPPEIRVTSKDIGDITTIETLYEVHVQAQDSRVFVYEGKVLVSSADSPFPAEKVGAGEWVRVRKGEKIDGPYQFFVGDLAAGPGSGSAECIYSNCKLTDKVPVPPPPVFTPQVLLPPPPNPPGQR